MEDFLNFFENEGWPQTFWKWKTIYRKAEYKAAHIWHSRHDFSILLILNVITAGWSGQSKCEQHWLLDVWMATCLYMSFGQGQAEQQDKLDAQSQMATCSYPFIFCCFWFFSVVFICFLSSLLLCPCRNWFLNNSISCQNVTSLFPFSPHSVADLWRE